MSSLPPVFLTTAGYYGTLAAVRSIGRAGIGVTVADGDTTALAKMSRYASTRLRCPDVREDRNRFLEWLLAFGQKSREKHVLLPTCDDTAWLYSRYRRDLASHFHVSDVPLGGVYNLLNKRRLTAKCADLGIPVPMTETAGSDAELRRVADKLQFPLIIKPSTQVYWKSRRKGHLVRDKASFVDEYHEFARSGTYLAPMTTFDADVGRPIIQEYCASDGGRVYNLAGYVDESGSISCFRASTKVFQISDIGTGICFDEAPILDEQVQCIKKLFRATGYHGIFEIEFVQENGKYLLIDANPRFYGELTFEVERGMPLPLIAYFDAMGDTATVRSLAASAPGARAPRAHTHRFGFEALLRLQRLAGAMSAEEERKWREWREDKGSACSDAVLDDDDVVPSLFDAAGIVYNYVRYPRSFLRTAMAHRLGKATRARAAAGRSDQGR